MKRKSLALVVVIFACLAVGSCGGSPAPTAPTTTPNQPTTPTPVWIQVTGLGTAGPVNFVVGAAAQFTAMAEYQGGSRKDVTSEAKWESADTAIVTVTTSGEVKGVGAGYVRLNATYNGVTGWTYLQVYPAGQTPAAACGFDGATGPQATDWQAKTSGGLNVLTGARCSWTATTDASWITLNGPVSGAATIGGTGSVRVSYSVTEYEYSTAPPRVGHITVRSPSGATRTTDVMQWANCTGSPKEQAVSFTADGGTSARFDVLLGWPAVCKWRIISDADWITISGASTTVFQMGDGDFHINASPNPGSSPRTARVYADYTVYVVTQAGR